MELFLAIDLREGRCVRLAEGDFGRETRYGDDPVAVACGFAAAGARWVHVVDLDAARTGEARNLEVVVRLAAASGLAVQAGGGVRSLDAAARLLDAGVARVVVGTAAVESPEMVELAAAVWPGRVAVGLDHRGGEVRVRGWVQAGARRVEEMVAGVVAAGAVAVIVTDIGRDGMLAGPDVAGLAALVELTGAPVIASGGVATLDDLRRLAAMRPGGTALVGAVVGKALHEGRFGVAEAMAACQGPEGGAAGGPETAP